MTAISEERVNAGIGFERCRHQDLNPVGGEIAGRRVLASRVDGAGAQSGVATADRPGDRRPVSCVEGGGELVNRNAVCIRCVASGAVGVDSRVAGRNRECSVGGFCDHGAAAAAGQQDKK